MSELDLVTGDVRSPAGHAAFSMRGTDDRWVLIQVNTFKNWINEQLRYCDMTVEDVQTDFCDGIKLCAMMENLQNKRVGRVVKKPHNQHQYLENVSLALRAMVNDGIKLVNIGGEDIVNGNLKLILGMLWRLILRYQIGKSKVPPKKLMLAWIKAVIPDLDITNFSSDWNDGIALHALVEYCKPGTCPNWRQLSRRDGLQNCRNAMDLAKQHFDIPLVLSPENLSSPDLDELSGMTYLSYFMKVDSPGFHATLNWVREQIPGSHVNNFQTDWNDGRVVAALTHTLGGSVPGWPDNLETQAPADIIQNAMNAAQEIGVSPVISAREMADTEVDHLGVMAYAAWFQHAVPPSPQPIIAPPSPVALVAAPPPRPPTPPMEIVQKTPPTEAIDVRVPDNQVQMNKQTTFLMALLDEDVDKRQVRTEVIGPNSKPSVTVNWAGDKGYAEFIPQEAGTHQVVVYNEGQVVKGCPIPVNVSYDISQVQLAAPVSNTGLVGIALPIQISAADARRGAVKVEARAPSGRLHDMGVIENNGVFTANFTPTEVGDWLISILYDGQHIQGSPFNVRVYDAEKVRVYGLEGGAVGKTFSFSVDTAGAGEGQLSVEIQHNGRNIPPQVHPDGPNRYRVSFTPEGGGIYTIRVHFAGMEVKGSPYTLEIVDSSQVTASGEGISSVEVNRRATFVVSTGHLGSSGDIRCTVTSPRGVQIPCQVINNGDGTHRVEYLPNEVGEYVVDVFYYGKPIQGSPFKVHAFDWNRISIKNLKSSGIVGRLVEFDIDAANAGSGNLEIMVNDGTIPCSVQNRGNRQFHASFMPKEAIPHQIQMRFNGREVPGSPWNIDIRTASHVTASGQGLQLVSTNRIASFEVRTGHTEGEVTAIIYSPTNRPVPLRVVNNQNGTHIVEYTPTEVGNYSIDVSYEGLSIPSSPFSSKAYDANAIIVSPIATGIVSKPVEFTVDVTQAGEGQLEIMVNRGAVPNSVRMMSKGVFHVSFVPRESRPHMIDIKFNGDPIPRTPITVPIMDASRVTVQGDGLRQVAVNKQSYFSVNTQSAGEADLSVRVTAPSGHEVPSHISQGTLSGSQVEFRPSEIGTYKIDVDYGGVAVPGSPFFMKCYDASQVLVQGIRDGIVGKQAQFIVDVNAAGEGDMEISIRSPSGQNIQNTVRQHGPGKFEVSYQPQERGQHQANISFNKQYVPGSPFLFNVSDISSVTLMGEGLKLVPTNKAATFNINAPGAQLRDLDIKITGPTGRDIYARAFDSGLGHFEVDYTPTETGEHKIQVLYHGEPVSGSPFTPRAWDASQVVVTNVHPGRISKPCTFNVDASRAGAGNLEIIVSASGENVPNFVKAEGNARFEVSFTPQFTDTHMISVKFNGEMVPGSPFVCEMLDDGKIHDLGQGYTRVPIGRPAVVGIDPRRGGALAETAVVEITAPSDRLIKAHVEPVPSKNMLKAEFVPREVGPHCIQVTIGNLEIPGSPFACEVYDVSRIKLAKIPTGVVGKPFVWEVDTSHAGAGDLTVVIQAYNRKIPSKLETKAPGIYRVYFMPKEPNQHLAVVCFSKEPIPGSPFPISVEDQTLVIAKGLGLESAPVNKNAPFTIDTSKAPFRADPTVKITGPPPAKRLMKVALVKDKHGLNRVEWLPRELGVHTIEIKYGNRQIVGSPFKCKVYDLSKVKIIRDDEMTGVDMDGIPGEDVVFYVDASEAGAGNLEIIVRCARDGTRIPNFLEAADHSGKFRIYFTPRPDCHKYKVDVNFNEQQVQGSPFFTKVIDGSRVSASGIGLQRVSANCSTHFQVQTNNSGEADLQVKVLAPNGQIVPSRVSGSSHTGFRVDYTPLEVGLHTIYVEYADSTIQGSPFTVDVFDATRVKIGLVKDVPINQQACIEVDTCLAGEGKLTAEILGPLGQPLASSIHPKPNQNYHVLFTPLVVGKHVIVFQYNQENVPGMFSITAFDRSQMRVDWESARCIPVRKSVCIELDPQGMPDAHIKARVLDPYGKDVPVTIQRRGSAYLIGYTPREVGQHIVELTYAEQSVQGSPFTSYVYDASRVQINEISPRPAMMGQPVSFTVDTSEAGQGDLDVEVVCGDRQILTRHQQIDNFKHKFFFTPNIPCLHSINILFNDQQTPDTPCGVPVMDPAQVMAVAPNSEGVAAGMPGHSVIQTRGSPINLALVSVQVTAPNGELVPAKIVMQPDGDYKVEYSSKYTGRHTVEILYAGQAIMGSPFYVEIYDPNKIQVEGTRGGMIGQKVSFDIIRHEAGRAELGLTINSPSGRSVAYQIDSIPLGDRVSYVPVEHGPHQIFITYGGLDVPGCPIRQDIVDSGTATAYGDGLQRGEEDKPATFYVDSAGRQGDLDVSVDGPNSIAKCHVEPDHSGKYLVTYVPVEVGIYNVRIKWNGRDIAGSPYRPHIVDVRKVRPLGGWETFIDSSNKMMLKLNETKYMEFDTRDAGPGKMTAEIRGPEAHVHCDVVDRGSSHIVSFTPRMEGEYFVKIFWNDAILPRCPIIGLVRDGMLMAAVDINHEKVVLTGHGLREARVREESEFVIDGTDAGPGVPDVKLSGVKTDIEVRCVSIGGNKYRCTYIPQLPGAYLLNIMWSDRQVRGSPFKVNVTASSDASKVQVTGEGTKCGVMGRDIKSIIDTRRAGPGELTAQCMGPSKMAHCELHDHNDGTFTLNVRPKEPGRHILQVKYGGEHVPGSPFTLRISGAPDASKVRVSGPGVENGILATYQSSFIVETRGAGAGQLTVRIRGPKGAFRVEMQRESQKDRAILCRYDPAEVGDYIIHVKWSGEHVPGSPFHVQIFDTQQELERFLSENPRNNPISGNTMTNVSTRSWAEDF